MIRKGKSKKTYNNVRADEMKLKRKRKVSKQKYRHAQFWLEDAREEEDEIPNFFISYNLADA